jgi:hypothetical protein
MTNIAGVLAACHGLLFGFDGPICDVFAAGSVHRHVIDDLGVIAACYDGGF